jgi:hypothetical protein
VAAHVASGEGTEGDDRARPVREVEGVVAGLPAEPLEHLVPGLAEGDEPEHDDRDPRHLTARRPRRHAVAAWPRVERVANPA